MQSHFSSGILCLILLAATFFSSAIHHFLSIQCRNNVDKREALENLDLIFLCLDEIVDQGYLFPTTQQLKTFGFNISIGYPIPVFYVAKAHYLFTHFTLVHCRIILETDPSVIAGKVAIHSMDGAAPLAEQVMHLSIFMHCLLRL